MGLINKINDDELNIEDKKESSYWGKKSTYAKIGALILTPIIVYNVFIKQANLENLDKGHDRTLYRQEYQGSSYSDLYYLLGDYRISESGDRLDNNYKKLFDNLPKEERLSLINEFESAKKNNDYFDIQNEKFRNLLYEELDYKKIKSDYEKLFPWIDNFSNIYDIKDYQQYAPERAFIYNQIKKQTSRKE